MIQESEKVNWLVIEFDKTEQLKNKHNQTSCKMELAGITRFCLGCMLLYTIPLDEYFSLRGIDCFCCANGVELLKNKRNKLSWCCMSMSCIKCWIMLIKFLNDGYYKAYCTTIGPHLQEFDLTLFTDDFNLHLTLLTCFNLVFFRSRNNVFCNCSILETLELSLDLNLWSNLEFHLLHLKPWLLTFNSSVLLSVP
ncbi:hypothetical protein P8452_18465 [Trifolium repens]|nr:hypothetical protein P8452_18465 [Trifolium repens]